MHVSREIRSFGHPKSYRTGRRTVDSLWPVFPLQVSHSSHSNYLSLCGWFRFLHSQWAESVCCLSLWFIFIMPLLSGWRRLMRTSMYVCYARSACSTLLQSLVYNGKTHVRFDLLPLGPPHFLPREYDIEILRRPVFNEPSVHQVWPR
ncbi:uncharacterized protein BDW47DRAFT_112951 [Aspergillus candidus]|uniref:Uncharacterized protein n=1 Tax=Aspergillus candidus TaxID=41067 RepID=A0A2I2F057_ASPCN|nr:hypothetical protein BDW47DRAFT_112951 [Aspergillus candidus]PLB34004.1 hypothetical protein BDW47DRAFT_112951 [Aspergillus candidus]